MKKLLLFFAVLLTTVFLFSGTVTAKTTQEEIDVQKIDSFDLFWPIVAGKTRADSLYSLKQLKEKVRGYMIFGVAKKVEYNVFLLVKRVVESEKLVNEGKRDFAELTLADARQTIQEARDGFVSGKETQVDFGEVAPQIMDRLTNLEKLIVWLSSKDEDTNLLYSDTLQELRDLKSIIQ